MKFIVYELLKPNGNTFYVGKTSKKRFRNRLNEHFSHAKNGSKLHVYNVIRKIWRNGGKIDSKIVFESMSQNLILKKEVEIIARSKNLTNLLPGGKGVIGYRHTDKTKRLLSKIHLGRKRSAETRKNISNSLIGHKVSSKTKNKISDSNRGKKRLPQHLKKMSEAHLGLKRSKTSIAKTSGTNSGMAKANWFIVRKIKSLRKKGLLFKEIAKIVNLSIATVNKIYNNKLWRK